MTWGWLFFDNLGMVDGIWWDWVYCSRMSPRWYFARLFQDHILKAEIFPSLFHSELLIVRNGDVRKKIPPHHPFIILSWSFSRWKPAFWASPGRRNPQSTVSKHGESWRSELDKRWRFFQQPLCWKYVLNPQKKSCLFFVSMVDELSCLCW